MSRLMSRLASMLSGESVAEPARRHEEAADRLDETLREMMRR